MHEEAEILGKVYCEQTNKKKKLTFQALHSFMTGNDLMTGLKDEIADPDRTRHKDQGMHLGAGRL